MPELYLDIRLNANEGDLKTIKQKLDEINKLKESTGGGAKGITREKKAVDDLNRSRQDELKALIRRRNLAEADFRLGKITQEQLQQTTKEVFNQAQAQELLGLELDQTGTKYKSFAQAQLRAEQGFKGVGDVSQRANQSLVNLGRIVQDLPFGFLGISNNIDPALSSFRQLKDESGGTGGALKALLGSLKGSGGLIFALGSLLPTAVLIAQRGMNFYAKQTDESKSATESLTESVKEFVSSSSRLREGDAFSFLGRDAIQAEITALTRLENVYQAFEEARREKARGLDTLLGATSTLNTVTGESVAAVKEYESQLGILKAQFGLTAEDIATMRKRLKELNDEIRQANALASLDDFARYREDIERVTDEYILLSEAGEMSASELGELARFFREQQKELGSLEDANEETRKKYALLDDQIQALFGTYDQLTQVQRAVVVESTIQEDAIQRLRKQEELRVQALEERIEAQKKLSKSEQNLPDETAKRNEDELQAFRIQQQIRNQLELQSLQGLALKKATIEQEYQQKREDLLSSGVNIFKEKITIEGQEMSIFRALELQKEREFQQALTDIEEDGEKERKDLRKQALDSTFAIASQYISSLQQLNQAQSDQTEAQARKRFDMEKKLAVAQAVVNGAAAVTKTFQTFGYPAGIPFAIAQAAAIGTQIRAIRRTQFESATQADNPSGGGSEESSERGFFITDVNESPVSRPEQGKQFINIEVENVLDKEGLALRVKEGNEKLSSRNFVVISNS